jgi:hypothetical protein
MTDKLKIAWYYIEVLWTKVLRLFNIRKSKAPIPEGLYCYKFDGTTGIDEKTGHTWFGTKTCKYYRCIEPMSDSVCTYVGFIGWDMCLCDQCKICGENHGKDYE